MHIILGKKDSRENYVVRNTVRLLISCSRSGQVARVSLFLGYICTFVITARLYRDKDHSSGVCKIRWYRWSRLFLKNLLVLLIGKSSIPLSLLENICLQLFIHVCINLIKKAHISRKIWILNSFAFTFCFTWTDLSLQLLLSTADV